MRSESPAFDLHHPEVAALDLMDEDSSTTHDAPNTAGRAEAIDDARKRRDETTGTEDGK